MVTEVRRVFTLMPEREHESTFLNAGNILYIDLGGGYTDVYICKCSSRPMLKIFILYWM